MSSRLSSALILGTVVALVCLAHPGASPVQAEITNTTCDDAIDISTDLADPSWCYGTALNLCPPPYYSFENPAPSCLEGESMWSSLWYKAVASTSGNLEVSAVSDWLCNCSGPAFYCTPIVVVYRVLDPQEDWCDPANREEIACAYGESEEPGGPPHARLSVCVNEADPLVIAVGTKSLSAVMPQVYDFTISLTPNATNTSCAGAMEVEPGETGFQDSTWTGCLEDPTVWYTLVPQTNGRITVDTCDSSGNCTDCYGVHCTTSYPTRITVFKGACTPMEALKEIVSRGPGGCGGEQLGTNITCIPVEANVRLFFKVESESESGGWLQFHVSPINPGMTTFWETDPEVLTPKLLKYPSTPGITILTKSVVVTPNLGKDPAIARDEAIGYYHDFDYGSGYSRLHMPDGIMLTTGRVNRPDGRIPYGITCDNLETDFVTASNDLSGDTQIQALYQASPGVEDGIGLELTFMSDARIGALRFNLILGLGRLPGVRGLRSDTGRHATARQRPVS